MSPGENRGREARLVVVAGSGRSGTSTLAGALKMLGLTVPQPEVPGSRANPRGHFEPRWAVQLQTHLLRESGVLLTDARPYAFEQTAREAADPAVRHEVAEWLREQLAIGPEVVIKDPRNSWFLAMWRDAATVAGAVPSFATMLRHPTEVVGSKDRYYKGHALGSTARTAQTTRLASWISVSLFAEEATRDTPRSFVRYTDLLTDWRGTVGSLAEALDLSLRQGFDAEREAAVDAFIDPDLRRVRTSWDDIDVPAPIMELADETWSLLNTLVDAGGSDPAAQAGLDAARKAYVEMYRDAEALVQSSVEAAAVRPPRRAGRKAAPPRAPDPPKQAKASGRTVLSAARGVAGRGRRGLTRLGRRLGPS